ncbi:hypothetical protein BBD42_03095 [Paenibacillus sp. BIHB 4019]|uniref:Uncharacterized protein n=1 Tax=Paenibacillus sp. BIHB 4019 TaxID=1870819 RepID=A0A1B2DCV9_9BACL|nr:hypothetical protein BBD42_03095 [Paenibacillus sp. BIHB 4019]
MLQFHDDGSMTMRIPVYKPLEARCLSDMGNISTMLRQLGHAFAMNDYSFFGVRQIYLCAGIKPLIRKISKPKARSRLSSKLEAVLRYVM